MLRKEGVGTWGGSIIKSMDSSKSLLGEHPAYARGKGGTRAEGCIEVLRLPLGINFPGEEEKKTNHARKGTKSGWQKRTEHTLIGGVAN